MKMNYEKGERLVLVCSNCGNNFITKFGEEATCNCGAGLNLYPLNVKIILAPTLEQAQTIKADITIESEYGDFTVKGSQYTSAHHGVNAGNPAPCNDDNIPYLQEGVILLSHIDLDSIIGCMRAFNLVSKDENDRLKMLCNAIEYIDVNGPHHLHKYGWMHKLFFNAYWAWNASEGRKERIIDVKDVTQEILESIEVIETIVKEIAGKSLGNENFCYIDAGNDWAENIQKATEEKLIEETEKYRLFSTDRVFCGASYYSPKQDKIIPAIISYNKKFNAITLSFEDDGKQFDAVKIMQELFGEEAGGKPGIAGTPRGAEFVFEDTKKVIEKLIGDLI